MNDEIGNKMREVLNFLFDKKNNLSLIQQLIQNN